MADPDILTPFSMRGAEDTAMGCVKGPITHRLPKGRRRFKYGPGSKSFGAEEALALIPAEHDRRADLRRHLQIVQRIKSNELACASNPSDVAI
jgi:hypothetical protein